jgi:hypothetical protein
MRVRADGPMRRNREDKEKDGSHTSVVWRGDLNRNNQEI